MSSAARTPSASAPIWRARPPEEHDFPRWRALYAAYADFYEVEQPDEAAALVWSWINDPAQELKCLLVEGDEAGVVGIAHYRPFARPLRANIGCFLDDLFVDPAHRGSGAADLLFEALRQVARERGWSVIRWVTAETNYRARGLYDRHASRTAWVTYDMAV